MQYIEEFVNENLNLFIESGNLVATRNNIKEFSCIYCKIYEELYLEFNQIFNEEDSSELSHGVISTFLNYLKSSGSLFLRNLKDVFFNAAMSKKISFISCRKSFPKLRVQF